MIYFMVGPEDDLTQDPFFDVGQPDITKALEFYRQQILDLMDMEDVLPGRFLVDGSTEPKCKAWRITVTLGLEKVGFPKGKTLAEVFAEEEGE